LFGVTAFEILIFETLVVANTMFHHANISLGRFDRPLRGLIVTPRMHEIHHSRRRPETDSNYSVLFSLWDRAFRTFRMRPDGEPVELGLDEFDDDRWQSMPGMLKTPFVAVRKFASGESSAADEAGEPVPGSAWRS
jgi:sterol desaturase/sphingolipid hydroxylase (fatty acid hydroxylase superfamily)